ncbi:hypothetical protein BDY24DRAFT_168673 [Mrakia frigida]|uniref:uncharacterized protein n=1 Tax=Mrakia frigida TaxID=29902 RepID=UPI003FCC1CA8
MPVDKRLGSGDSSRSSTGLPWSLQDLTGEASDSFSFAKNKGIPFPASKPLETGASSLLQINPSAPSTTNGTKSTSSSSSHEPSSSRYQPLQQHSPSPSAASSTPTNSRLPPSPTPSASSSKHASWNTGASTSSSSFTWVSKPSQLLNKPPPSKRLGTGQPGGGPRDQQQQKKSPGSSRTTKEISSLEDDGDSESVDAGETQGRVGSRPSTTRPSGSAAGAGFADFAASIGTTNNNNAKPIGLDWLASSTGDGSSDSREGRNSGSPPFGSGSGDLIVTKSSSPAEPPEIFGRPASVVHPHSTTTSSSAQKSSKSSQQQHKSSNSNNTTYLDLLPRPSNSTSSSSTAVKKIPSSSLAIPPFTNKAASTSTATPPPSNSNASSSKGSGAAKSQGGSSSSSITKNDEGRRSTKPPSTKETEGRGEVGSSGKKRPRTESDGREGEGQNSARKRRMSVLQDIEDTYREVEEKEKTIGRLRSELTSQEKKHHEVEGQLAEARKLALSSRNKFDEMGSNITSLIDAKQAIDDQRRKLELEVQGLRSLLEEVQDLDQKHDSWLQSSTSWIEKQRTSLDDVIHPLQTERDQALLKAERFEQSLELVREELESKRREVEERKERVRVLEGDVDRKVETIRSLALEVKNAGGEEQRLQIEQLRAELATETERADTANQTLEDERKDQDSAFSRLEQHITDLEKDLRDKEGELDSLRNNIEEERESLKRSKSLITRLEGELSTTKQNLETARGDVTRERGLLKAETASLEEVKKKHSEVKVELGETKKELGETKQKLTDLGATLKETEERSAVVVKAKKNLEKSLADLETTIQNLRSDQTSSSGQITKANGKTQEAEVEIQSLKRDLRVANQAKDDPAADLKLPNSQVSDLEKRLSSAASTISTSRSEKTSLEEKIAALESEKTSLQGEKRQMQRDLDDAKGVNAERDRLVQSIKDSEAKKATVLERYISGEADPDEITMVEAFSKAVEESHETEHEGAIEKLETKVKDIEKERRELAVKLAKANAGKSRSITSSSPVVPLSDTRDDTSPPSPFPANSDPGSDELAALKLADKVSRNSSSSQQSQHQFRSKSEPEEDVDQLANDSSSDDDVKLIEHRSEPRKKMSSSLSDPPSNKDTPIEIASSSPVAASVPRASPAPFSSQPQADDDEEEEDELEDDQKEVNLAMEESMEGVKEGAESITAAEGSGSRVEDAVGEESSKGEAGVGVSRKRTIEEAIIDSAPTATVSPKRLRNGRIAAPVPAPANRTNSNGRRRGK